MGTNISESNNHLFFKLYLPLLFYSNQKLNVIKGIDSFNKFMNLPLNDKLLIRNKLYENKSLFDNFIYDNPNNFLKEELGIINTWMLHHIKGSFILLKCHKSYNILLDNKNNYLYGVMDLYDPLKDLLEGVFPVRIHTILLPFLNIIIHDGLTSYDNIYYGSGIKRELNELYNKSKLKYGIITSLPYFPLEDLPQKDQLLYYLQNDKNREYFYKDIMKLVNTDHNLKVIYYQHMGKLYSKQLSKKLISHDIVDSYFSILFDTVICSSLTKHDLLEQTKCIIDKKNLDLVYIFHFKKGRKPSPN